MTSPPFRNGSPAPGDTSRTNAVPDTIASPCIRRCTLTDEGVCLGCGRTIDDITRWSKMSPLEKQQCIEQAQQTLRQLKRPTTPG